MSLGDRSHPVDARREQELRTLLDQPWFQQAVSAYKGEDDTNDVPFAGGSDNAGHTVYWDRHLSAYIKHGKFKIGGRSEDPRRGPGKTHEAIEGAILRNWPRVSQLLHWPQSTPKYDTAHDIATLAEMHVVHELGWNPKEYQDAWRECLPAIEHEKVSRPPPDLLKVPYDNSPQAAEVGDKAKLSHKAVQYSQGHRNGDRCGICKHYQATKPPHCEIVVDPMNLGVIGWCDRFVKK